jgi:lysophospholipid acyltransferase (LPLAT)-like uncharacterized protein
MIVPIPFSRAIYLYGDPIEVPRRGDVEEWRGRVERVLNDLAATAEEQFELLWKEKKDEG